MSKIKFLIAFLIMGIILNCSWLSHKVEQKVDEKVNKTLEENKHRIDSIVSKENLDSMERSLDSISNQKNKNNR